MIVSVFMCPQKNWKNNILWKLQQRVTFVFTEVLDFRVQIGLVSQMRRECIITLQNCICKIRIAIVVNGSWSIFGANGYKKKMVFASKV